MATIDLHDVTIDIPIHDASRSLRKAMFAAYTGGSIRSNRQGTAIRSLENLTLSLRDGDRLGLVGHNGSGKSTLLKVMAGLYEPTLGSVHRTGRITALFNPKVGLDPDLTGVENIEIIAYYLGMTPAELQVKREEIIDFCELGEFIHLPARTYSTGMMVRLSFAVATAMEPDILLLDEEIGTGDARFADRAKSRFEQFYHGTRCLVVASHSDDLIRSLCNKALLLEHGRLKILGTVDEVLDHYHHCPVPPKSITIDPD